MSETSKWSAFALCVALFATAGCNEALSPSALDDSQEVLQQDFDVAGKGMGPVVVSGQWVALFDDEVLRPRDLSRQIQEQLGVTVRFTYERAVKGMSFNSSPEIADLVRLVPGVASVVEDMMAYPTVTQTSATWGIDRIDQRARPLSTSYTYDKTGLGVRVYVIDSGIDIAHTQFSGRAFVAKDYVGDGKNDCSGHGTHVAGTIGSTLYGVAKKTNLYSVRIFPCTGGASMSTVIAAVDFVTSEKLSNPSIPFVANMSLTASFYSALNTAISRAIANGVVFAVAAGNNSGMDACTMSPASVPDALTVAASTNADVRLAASNIGPCVDLFAPGGSILSTAIGGRTATMSGTSMASPHVAGVAALLLHVYPQATPAEIGALIIEGATPNVIADAGTGTPNRLLYSQLGPPPPNSAPVASFTNTDPNLTIVFTDKSTDGDGTIASRLWNFGDGTTSTATNPSRTFPATGTYTVSLTVTDNQGATNTFSKTITVFTTYVSRIYLTSALKSGKYIITASVYTRAANKATGTFTLNGTTLNTVTATATSSGVASLKSISAAATTGSVFKLQLANNPGGISSCQITIGSGTTANCI